MKTFDFSVVRNLRKKRGMSAEELAQKANVTRGTVVKIEAGDGNPTVQTVEALAGVLQLTASELVRLAEGVRFENAQSEDFERSGYRGKRIWFHNLEIYWLKARAGLHIESELELHENTAEVCVLLSGRLVLTVGGEPRPMEAQSAVRFNALHEHRFEVVEESEFLLIHHRLI